MSHAAGALEALGKAFGSWGAVGALEALGAEDGPGGSASTALMSMCAMVLSANLHPVAKLVFVGIIITYVL
jgi:hypothetical protein